MKKMIYKKEDNKRKKQKRYNLNDSEKEHLRKKEKKLCEIILMIKKEH